MAKEIAYILPILLVIPFVLAVGERKSVAYKPKIRQKIVALRPLSKRLRDYYASKYEYVYQYYK